MSDKLLQLNADEQNLFLDITLLIEQNKKQVVVYANSTLTLLFWQVGKKVNKFTLQHKRAEYGKKVIISLSQKLVARYGKNFEPRNLRRMLQFAEQFSDIAIVATLSAQLSWSHFSELLTLKNHDAKLFYANKIIDELWSVRELRKQKERKAYERALVANTQLPTQIKETQNILKILIYLIS